MKKKRKRNRSHTWFVCPENSFTNQVIARVLPPEDCCNHYSTTQGQKNLWICPWDFIKRLQRDTAEFNLKFEVFVREGDGQIRPAPYFLQEKQATV